MTMMARPAPSETTPLNGAMAMLDAAERLHDAEDSGAEDRQAPAGDPQQHGAALHRLGVLLAQQGKWAEAERLLAAARQLLPTSAHILNDLGNVLKMLGRPAEAIRTYEAALAIDPGYAQGHCNLGAALQAEGQDEAAVAHYRRALAAEPGYVIAHYNLGNALQRLKRFEDSLASYQAALALKPDFAEAHRNLGTALQMLKRYEEALPHYEQALAIKPGFVDVHNDFGNALQMLERHQEAIAQYRRLLAAQPDHAKAHYNLGNALRNLGRQAEAIACYERAIALDPDYCKARNNLGTVLNALGRPRDAIVHYDHILSVDPAFAGVHNNYGNALQALDEPERAIAYYEGALALDPSYVDVHSNIGHALHALNRHQEALGRFRQALAIDPDHCDANWNEALTRLAVGDYAQGWRKYEWRWRNRSLGLSQGDFKEPLWLGEEDLNGRTILLHAEQGMGDTLQFARYVPMVAALGARVVLQVQAPLAALLGRLPGVAAIRARGEPLPPFDCHCPLMSLPLAFGTRLDTIPNQLPYLQAPEAKRAFWRRLLTIARGPRVGLVWSGNPAHKNDRNRSISLETLERVLDSSDCRFFALQKELRPGDAERLAAHPNLVSLGDRLEDFTDTAAIISELDLVVTVDTSIAHLAGALGKPVWILVAFAADWRWLHGRDDSPWYPSARLFRQTAIGDWDGVVDRLAAAIGTFRRDWSETLATPGVAA